MTDNRRHTAARHTEGRRGASRARPTGTKRRERANGRTSDGTHSRQEQERRTNGGKRGKKERGTRMATRLGSGGGKRSTAAGRERTDRQRKKRYINI